MKSEQNLRSQNIRLTVAMVVIMVGLFTLAISIAGLGTIGWNALYMTLVGFVVLTVGWVLLIAYFWRLANPKNQAENRRR